MKLRLILLFVAVLVSASVQAQEPAPREDGEGLPQAVTNGDRGRAFIIEGEMHRVPVIGNQGRVIAEPEQNSIFLGSGWKTASLRTRVPELGNLLANLRDQSQIKTLDQSGIKNFFAATSTQEKLDDFGDRVFSDLEIESLLTAMIKEGSLNRPNANTIYVVFLGPEIRSTLGAMIGGKHYLAYHNFFNATGIRVHYVVVPFLTNKKTAYQVALRAFQAAAVNPNGARQ